MRKLLDSLSGVRRRDRLTSFSSDQGRCWKALRLLQYRSVALYCRLSIFMIDSNQQNRHKHR